MQHLGLARLALATAAGIATIVAACAGSSSTAPSSPAPSTSGPDRLDGTSWALTSIGDVPSPAGTTVTLSFAAGLMSGSAGCNTYRGSYTVDGTSLLVGALATTKKACPEPVMTAETTYLAALASVTRWAVPQDAPIGTQLTIFGSGPKLVFGPPPADATTK